MAPRRSERKRSSASYSASSSGSSGRSSSRSSSLSPTSTGRVPKSKKAVRNSKSAKKSRKGEVALQAAEEEASHSEGEVIEEEDEGVQAAEQPAVQGPLMPESFWPILRRHALGRADPEEAKVEGVCPVCYDPYDIFGLQNTPVPGPFPQVCNIMPCGHTLCRNCAFTTFRIKKECPICRTRLECDFCPMVATVDIAPGVQDNIDMIHQIPPTVPEGGAYKPVCRRCRNRDAFMERILKGDEPAQGEFIEPGFVRFVYHIIHHLEERGTVVNEANVADTMNTILREELRPLFEWREHQLHHGDDTDQWW